MTRDDRKRIAEHLYGAKQWTMQAIGDMLGVSQQTISADLENCSLTATCKPPRPKGGRPKSRNIKVPPETQARNKKIVALYDGAAAAMRQTEHQPLSGFA